MLGSMLCTVTSKREGVSAESVSWVLICAHRASRSEGPAFGLTLCHHCLEILNNFLTKGICIFHFALGLANYVASPGPSPCPAYYPMKETDIAQRATPPSVQL